MRLHAALLASLGASGSWSLAVRQANSTVSATSALPTTSTSSPGSAEPTSAGATRWIVEVADPSVVDAVTDALVKEDPTTNIIEKWKDNLFPGLCLESALDQNSLTSVNGIQRVWKSKKVYPPPPPPVSEIGNGNGTVPGNGTAPPVNGTAPSRFRRFSPLSRRQGNTEPASYQAENYSAALHRMTGVDKLHKEGVLGAGMLQPPPSLSFEKGGKLTVVLCI